MRTSQFIRGVAAGVLAAAIMSSVTRAQPPGGFSGPGLDVRAAVVDDPNLQAELKITDAQREKFKSVAGQLGDLIVKRKIIVERRYSEPNDTETVQKLVKEYRELLDKIGDVVEATLTGEQKQRLKQISVQLLEFEIFHLPPATPKETDAPPLGKSGKGPEQFSPWQKAVRREATIALNLSSEQVTAIQKHNRDFMFARLSAIKEAGNKEEAQAAAKKRIDELRAQTIEKIEALLDAKQKEKWREMRGEPYDTSKLRPPRPKWD